ncbi:hypothetical protein GUITHDRAFT_116524, partial [Guillardia theta CCMP2712]
MVLQYDENVRNLLYRRSCQYTQSGLVDASVLEADLVERVKSFAKRYPNSRTAQACKAVEGCTPDAIAEAIRSTSEKLWQGREDFAIDGRKFTAVHVSIVHDRSFKIRAKRGPWGKGGSLAELTHLLTLGGMTTAEIAAVYRYQLLRQSLAAVQLQPLAGMLVAGAPGQQVHKGLGQKGFIAVGANVIWRQREVEWIVSSSCPEANDTAFRAFRESEAMEGVHLTLFSEDPKIREALAVELTADRFVSRNKLKKASRMQKKAGGKDGKEIKIIIKSTAASGRFTRKEMEGLCNGGNTSIARVKRVLLEIATQARDQR